MIKRIGKLKQQKGAVLFAVIAVMTLLIAMASTAYYTARGAHNTVVSNYNYSQLYMSAISVADMISESVINDTAINAETTNNFKPLKEALANLNTPGSSVMAYSPNITDATKSNGEIINQLANSGVSVIDGTLDGITIKIELPTNGVTYRNYADGTDTATGKPVRFHYYDYTYVFTTTAFYNGNCISVEDYLTTVKVKKSTGEAGTPGAPDIPGTPGNPGNNNVSFSTFFTATGQDFGPDGGYVKTQDRAVTIITDEITDDAFFENSRTFFNTGRDNKFKGGITASGSVYLSKFSCDGINQSEENENDWFIGDDLVLASNDAKDLVLGEKNNLYVGRDLVLASNAEINAGDIFVEGDVYIIGQVKITGSLHVNGSIKYELDSKSDVVTAMNKQGLSINTKDDNVINNGWSVSKTLDVNGSIVLPSKYPDDATAKITVSGQDNKVTAGAASRDDNNIGKGYNSAVKEVTVSNRYTNTESDTFDLVKNTMYVKEALELKTNTNNVYASYTSKQSAYNNKVDIDFSQLEPVEFAADKKTPVRYEYTFEVADGDDVKDVVLEYDKTKGTATVKIPYVKDGILLDIDSTTLFNNGFFTENDVTLEYEIGEGSPAGETMSVVLADNAEDSDGNPAFSWRGTGTGTGNNSAGKWTAVSVMGDGNVTFEMANYSLDKPDTYIPYDPNKNKEMGTVKYVVDQHEIVGTEAQVDHFRYDESEIKDKGPFKETKSIVSEMFKDGKSEPKDEFQNRVMLVSNAVGERAIVGDAQNNTFCGYMYAPNGEYYVGDGSNSNMTPVFGGMIVSTYTASKATYTYAEPKPSLISQMLGSLVGSQAGSSGGTEGTPDIPGTPDTPPTPPDDSYVTWAGSEGMYGYDWQYQGTNYLG